MNISAKRLNSLKSLLKSKYGLDYSDEEAQEAGVAIMRFAKAKLQRNYLLENGDEDGKQGTEQGSKTSQ